VYVEGTGQPALSVGERLLDAARRDGHCEVVDESAALAFVTDVTSGATRHYLKFAAGKIFAEVHVRKGGLEIYVRPEGFSIPKGSAAILHELKVTHMLPTWSPNHSFKVRQHSDVDGAVKLIRQSYDAVR